MGALLSKVNHKPASASEKMTTETCPLAFRHYAQAQSKFQPPLIANDNAFLGDVFSNSDKVKDAPLSCGLYRLKPGQPLEYTYTYHEMKIILEGDFTISDETGQKVEAKPGDVFNFPKGSKIRFETKNGGLAFYTGQRAEGAA
ncbi:MAG: hypothetical protein MMC23_000768 [Stictis urceolatum]|nr:hypothetical protein [Stictis urceolata]